MIVATFPILIGLGVDYALHMVNRIEEVRRKKIDACNDENERRRRQGKPPEEVPDIWDANFYKECILEMASSTGVAVFLSAMTTIIGFSVLIATLNRSNHPYSFCWTDIGDRNYFDIDILNYFSTDIIVAY